LDGLTLVTRLNKIAGDNGVGRVDIMEDRLLGLKVRENYECPASTVLIKAHNALESLVATAAERKFKLMVDQQWGELAYYGLWFDPLKDDLEAFIGKIQERVTGTVTLRLFKSSLTVVGRASEWALYNEDLASFDLSRPSSSAVARPQCPASMPGFNAHRQAERHNAMILHWLAGWIFVRAAYDAGWRPDYVFRSGNHAVRRSQR